MLSNLSYSQEVTQDCDKINIKVSTQVEDSSLKFGEVKVNVENHNGELSFLFYDKNQKMLTEDIKSNQLKGLAVGNYKVTVLDKKGCLKTVDFQIQVISNR